MKYLICLGILLLQTACGVKKAEDERAFGSLQSSLLTNDQAGIGGEGDLGKDKNGDKDADGKDKDQTQADKPAQNDMPSQSDKPNQSDTPNQSEPPKLPPKPPQFGDDVKAKLAKCYPNYDKGALDKDAVYEVRELKLDTEKLKDSNIELAGDKLEVVFVELLSATKIRNISMSLLNPKALYCVDIKAAAEIENMEVRYIKGAKLGTIGVDADKAKKVSIVEIEAK